MTRILLLDDELKDESGLRAALGDRRYDVDAIADRDTALAWASARTPDLVVLDLKRPHSDGVEMIESFRRRTSASIMVLSGWTSSNDKVAALDAGADDYVTKPFDLAEVLARIRAIVRRRPAGGAAAQEVRIGRHTVNLDDCAVRVTESGQRVKLTPIQWKLLRILVGEPGRVVPHERLLREVWGAQYESETAYLRQYVIQLRRKLEDDPAHPRHLINEAGRGYSYHP